MRKRDHQQEVATIVLAGGQGTRLFPLTAYRCKPAVPFGGRYRLIDIPLSNSLNSKIYQIFVISQYFASELHSHILSTYALDHFKKGGISLLTPQETAKGKSWFKGTADAIRQNLDEILQIPANYFLILSGDQLYNMDLAEIVQFAKTKRADLVVAAIPVEEPEAKRMGVLKTGQEREIVKFVEKPQDPELLNQFKLSPYFLKELALDNSPNYWLGSMGIYLFKRSALVEILKENGDDFGRHLIPKFIHTSRSFAYVYQGYWEDIGTVASYYRANMILTQNGQGLDSYDESNPIYAHPEHIPGSRIHNTRISKSLISHGAIIEAEEITQSIIGPRAHIKRGSTIRESIVMGNQSYQPNPLLQADQIREFSIGEECRIEKAIIDEHVQIGNRVQLINQQKLMNWDGEGIFVRDGIIIVTSGTNLPDQFVF